MGYWYTQHSTRRLRLHDGYLVAFDSIPKKLGCTRWRSEEIYANPNPEMVAAITATAKKCHKVGYNEAALAFINAGGNNIKNHHYWVVNAVIASSDNYKLLLACIPLSKLDYP